MNGHLDAALTVELFGLTLALAQDPNSGDLGTTVWDASIVAAKLFEKNERRGDFARARVTGARALELGAGAGGLAGLALAALGAHVTLTDVAPVLPLLRANAERTMSKAALAVSAPPWAAGAGAVTVAELDWSNQATWHPGGDTRPYDIVIAADCIYSETAVPAFLAALLAHSDRKTTILVANELRSHSVAAAFDAAITPHFTVRRVPRGRQHASYQHENIHLLLLKRKAATAVAEVEAGVVKLTVEDGLARLTVEDGVSKPTVAEGEVEE